MIIYELLLLNDSCAALRLHRVLTSQSEFSRRFLLRDKSYLRSMWCRQRRPSPAVMAQLEWSLQQEIVSYRGNPHLGQSYAVLLNAAYACLTEQLERVKAHRVNKAALQCASPANDNTVAAPISPAALCFAPAERQCP